MYIVQQQLSYSFFDLPHTLSFSAVSVPCLSVCGRVLYTCSTSLTGSLVPVCDRQKLAGGVGGQTMFLVFVAKLHRVPISVSRRIAIDIMPSRTRCLVHTGLSLQRGRAYVPLSFCLQAFDTKYLVYRINVPGMYVILVYQVKSCTKIFYPFMIYFPEPILQLFFYLPVSFFFRFFQIEQNVQDASVFFV